MMFWELFSGLVQQVGNWLWLAVIVPLGGFLWVLIQRLLKKYAEGIEESAGPYLKEKGQATFQRLLTFGFRAKYNQHLIHTCRIYEIQGLKTRGPFTLDLEKVFVPLRVSPESPQKASADLLRAKAVDKALSIWEVLAAAQEQPGYRRVAVIGAPGSGKTTLLRHLALVHAQQRQRRYHPKASRGLPVLLYLRDLQEPISTNAELDLADWLQNQKQIYKLNPAPGWFKRQLQKSQCLVLLDGLDEVADADQRKAVGQWVNQQMLNYPNACFILTSRPFGYRNAPLERIDTVLDVQPFNLEQMGQFLNNWYWQNEIRRQNRDDVGVREQATAKAADLRTRILAHSTLAAMAVNPLLLTMIATVHDNRGALPGRRVELYGEICDVLLGRRQEAKGLAYTLNAIQKQRVLQTLALGLMEAKTRSFTLDEGDRHIHYRLARVAGPELTGRDFLKQVEDLSGLLVQREVEVYEFAHKSFQEYLAAVEIKEANLADYLRDKLADPWWEETVRLYAVQTRDASGLLGTILSSPTMAGLALAYECLEEGVEVQPDIRRELQNQVEAGLESSKPEVAKLAAQVKLAQRLKHLTPLDDKRFIDGEYVTCAEYQLFIDGMHHQDNKHRQPDHWKSDHFPSGTANQPIAGVRAADAVEFCEWLTQQSAEVGVRYRLPSPQEAQQFKVARRGIGCWCEEAGGSRYIYGADPGQLKQVQAMLRRIFHNDYKEFIARNLDRDRALDRDPILDRALDRVLALDRERERDRVLGPAITRALDRDFDRYLALEREHARDFALDRALDRVRTLDRVLDLDRDLDPDFDRALTRVLDRALDLALALGRALDPALDRDLDPGFDRALDRNLALDPDLDRALDRYRNLNNLANTRLLSCGLVVIWLLIRKEAHHFMKKGKVPDRKLDIEKHQRAALDLYTFLVLIDERHNGDLPVWEGIRILKERVAA